MEIKRTKINTILERRILTAMIISDKFLSDVIPMHKHEYWDGSGAGTVAKWCIDYFKKYEKAPGKHIQDIYEEQIQDGRIEESHLKYIELLLSGLSDQYEQDAEPFNSEYLLDRAEKWFKKRSLEILVNKIQANLSQENVDQAEELFLKYSKMANDKSTGNLKPLSTSEMMELTAEVVEWIWDLIIPAGTFIGLSGFMKDGKTELYNQLVEKLVRGIAFFRFDCALINILIIDLENPPALRRRWIADAGLDKEEGLFIHMGPLPYTGATLNELKSFITTHNIKLVIIDTVVLFWNLENENDNSEVQRTGRLLLNLTRETGCTILAVCHESKAGGEGGRSVRGASSLWGLFDQLLILNKRHGGTDTQRVLKIKGRYSESPKELILDFKNKKYICLGKADEFDKRAIRCKVQEALKSGGSLTIEQILAVLKDEGMKSGSVRAILMELEKEEVIIKDGTGVKGDPYMYKMNET